MKLSRKFLNEVIDINDIDTNTLANELVLVGNEYESIYKLSNATNIIVGNVLEAYPHPNSDHLTVCKVDVGNYTLQILCGAPNVRANIKVMVALSNAVLPSGITILKREIRGLESNGMICSLAELGIEHKYLTEEDKSGIHILPNDAKVGEDALKYLQLDDEVIDFELTANRGDLMSILGFAYEVGAVFNKKVEPLEYKLNNEVDDINNYMSLTVDTSNCPLYLGRAVKNIKIGESPIFLKSRLIASGIRPINNVVDISNYVMLLFGTPLHFFDMDRLNKNILVRMASNNEEIVTLDKNKRILDNSDIVITSDNKPIALAGVMGGLDSEIENTTTNVFIESAIFNPVSIRKTAKKILKSEASNRFEKGIDKCRCYMAIDYACYLLEKYASGEVIKNTLIHDTILNEEKIISITLNKISSILGIDLELNYVVSLFNRLNFTTKTKDNTIFVTVPTYRLDISIEEDLIEEIGRLNKMDNLESKMPIMPLKAGSYEKEYYKKSQIKARLTALGLFEVVTYTLVDNDMANNFNNNNKEIISILDPLSADKKYLRTSLIPSLLNVLNYNVAHGIKDIDIFEISDVYYDKDKYTPLLTILTNGNYMTNELYKLNINNNFYLLKGIVENLFNYLGLSNRYDFKVTEIPHYFHPYCSSSIILDNEVIGFIGLIHPNVSKDKVYGLEINLDKILNIEIRGIKNKEVSKYPSIKKDLAIIVDKNIMAKDLIKTIKNSGKKLLEEVSIFDIYEGDKIDNDKMSIAFSLKFSDSNKTLTEIEVMDIFNNIINDLVNKHHAILRDK